MKNDLKKQQLLKKALDALQQQALRDEQIQQLKGGGGGDIDHGQTAGMIMH